MKNIKTKFLLSVLIFLFINVELYSNNLRISNFRYEASDVCQRCFHIYIDSIMWDNSWRNDLQGPGYFAPYNYDAIWLFAKFRKKNNSIWYPAKFPSPGSGYINVPSNCTYKIPNDSIGIFLYRSQNGSGNVKFQNIFLTVFNNNLIMPGDTIDFRISAIEMVYIPQDSFYVGDGSTTNITGQFSASDNLSPYRIIGEGAITLGGLGTNSLNNRNASGMSIPDDFNNSSIKILPAEFPKGYNSFYCMKYELSTQQYVDFLNSLDTLQASTRFADSYGIERNSVQKINNKYVTNAPDRANNFMAWGDGTAYADWCGLRPMTELEMEKVSRGPLFPIPNEYAWGNTILVQLMSFSGADSSGTETGLPNNANCNYNLVDGGAGHPIGGPARVGIFATSTSDRVLSGSSYYGVMEMTGNCWERPVSVGDSIGRKFNGLHGNGILDQSGDANVLYWPSSNSIGSSFRMSNWFRGTERARISDRFFGATPINNRTGHRGFRCVRTSN